MVGSYLDYLLWEILGLDTSMWYLFQRGLCFQRILCGRRFGLNYIQYANISDKKGCKPSGPGDYRAYRSMLSKLVVLSLILVQFVKEWFVVTRH